MKEYIKIFLIFLSRFFLSIFKLFPITKNRILFISFSGKDYTCNPKYIYEELQQKEYNFEYIWVINNNTKIFSNSTKVIKYKSLSFFYYILTSKLIITNYSITPKIPIRRNQVLINTWHGGGAYKKVGLTNNTKEKKRVDLVFRILAKETTYFLSSCKIQTNTIHDTFHINKNSILTLGYPRNDIFFKSNLHLIKENLKHEIFSLLEIPSDSKILLFAPTYKGQPGFGISTQNITLNLDNICNVLSNKFKGNFVCIYRSHYYLSNSKYSNCFNGNQYPDMQHLLIISDVLITDYSSSIWDFSFLKKPCFLFTPDLLEYSKSQEFYVPIDKWGFSYASTEEELTQNIINFDQNSYTEKIIEAHNYFGAYDKGNASNKLIDILDLKYKGNK